MEYKNSSLIVQDMDKYIATPGFMIDDKWVPYSDYEQFMNIVKRQDAVNDICIKHIHCCQFHGGDLFAHSQWTAMQIIQWVSEGLVYILVSLYNSYTSSNFISSKTVDLVLNTNILALAGFFHDLGKGGDCIYDVYDSRKYNKEGDAVHPTWCGDIISGKIKYKICKSNKTETETEYDVHQIFKSELKFTSLDILIISVCAYMHWELGKINANIYFLYNDAKISNKTLSLQDIENNVNEYIKKFHIIYDDVHKHLFGLEQINESTKAGVLIACIIIAAGDITASTNNRFRDNDESYNTNEFLKFFEDIQLQPKIFNVCINSTDKPLSPTQINIKSQKYPAKLAWEEFKMNLLFFIYCQMIFKLYCN